MALPRPNGKAMPAAETLAATRQLLMRKRRSVSRPTRKKEDQAQVRDEVEVGNRGFWEDGICKTWDATKDRGAQQHAGDDFCNDSRLTNLGEGPV